MSRKGSRKMIDWIIISRENLLLTTHRQVQNIINVISMREPKERETIAMIVETSESVIIILYIIYIYIYIR